MSPVPDKTASSAKPINAWFAEELEQWSRDVREFFAQFRRELADVVAASKIGDTAQRKSGSSFSQATEVSSEQSQPPSAPDDPSQPWSEDRFAQLKRQLNARAERDAPQRGRDSETTPDEPSCTSVQPSRSNFS